MVLFLRATRRRVQSDTLTGLDVRQAKATGDRPEQNAGAQRGSVEGIQVWGRYALGGGLTGRNPEHARSSSSILSDPDAYPD